MELLQLKYFLAAAKYEHITQAAKALHIAQPALSQSIHRLESELGVLLFDRKNRGITLNDMGKRLEERLLPIMSALDHLPAELQAADENAGRTIRLNLLTATALVTSCIISYKILHPDIIFQLSQDQNDTVYDLSISSAIPGNVLDSKSMVLLQEDFYLAVPANSAYSLRTSISLSETRNEGYISFSGSKPIRTICDQFCLAAGFTPRIAFESDSPEAVRNLIAAGLGIGFWPKYSWGPLPNLPQVVLLSIDSPVCRRDIIITYDPTVMNKGTVADFYEYLTAYIRDSN